MKKVLFIITSLIFILASCKTSKDYLSRVDEDKTLFDIVKKLNKNSNDENATNALGEVYKQAQQRHLKKIATYKSNKEISRWDRIFNEYNILQNMFAAIDNSDAARRLVSPADYETEILAVKNDAAEDYYQLGETYLDKNTRENSKKAYNAFKKSGSWVKNYKDSQSKMEEAFDNSIVNVMINPIFDNSFFFNTGWGNAGYNYSNEYFQQSLVRDLGGKYASRYPAKFYTDWEARRENIQPDWVVELTLRDMDIPRPTGYNYSRNVSRQIEIGKDTSGKAVYKTVYATLNVQRQSFNARARMEVNITEVATRRNIAYNSYQDNFNWQQERATFSGDRRALSDNEWALVNRSDFNSPGREDILNQLYQNIYPQVKNRISNEVDW